MSANKSNNDGTFFFLSVIRYCAKIVFVKYVFQSHRDQALLFDCHRCIELELVEIEAFGMGIEGLFN